MTIVLAMFILTTKVYAENLCLGTTSFEQICSLGSLKSDNFGWSNAVAVSANGATVVGSAENDFGDQQLLRSPKFRFVPCRFHLL